MTIITINYNNVDGLKKTISSVIMQTYQYFQYLIVDGGSVDGSCNVIRDLNFPKLNTIVEKDEGIYYAMNKAIAIADGK